MTLPAASLRQRSARTSRRALRRRIPRARLHALDRGHEACRTLGEWLAVDMATLLDELGVEVGQERALAPIADQLRSDPSIGVTRRLAMIGEGLHAALGANGPGFERVAVHRSDVVRQWACYAIGAAEMPLSERLERLLSFAADRNMTVRECAWMVLRPSLARDLEHGIRLLEPLVRHADPNIRRFAVEVSRPRSVWGRHLEALKRRPQIGVRLLDPVRSDPSLYVRRAVANWLNDASKSTPHWVSGLCTGWMRERPTPETSWIVRRALRTMERRVH